MHYYEMNIGDYRRDTVHLSLLEHGIYRCLLDTYYLTEQPLCADHAKLMRSHSVRSAEEMQAFENVISDFFILTEEGYRHTRCDMIIAKYKGKSASASASAHARWSKTTKEIKELPSDDANAMRTHSEGNADGMLTTNHKPITNIKEKKQKKAAASPLNFYGSDEIVVADFQKQRKTKLTQTALDGIKREADKAGLSMNDALSMACIRGWQSFRASWVLPDAQGQAAPAKAVDMVAETKQLIKSYEGGKSEKPKLMPKLGSLVKNREVEID